MEFATLFVVAGGYYIVQECNAAEGLEPSATVGEANSVACMASVDACLAVDNMQS